jgi:hypothetical protein
VQFQKHEYFLVARIGEKIVSISMVTIVLDPWLKINVDAGIRFLSRQTYILSFRSLLN